MTATPDPPLFELYTSLLVSVCFFLPDHVRTVRSHGGLPKVCLPAGQEKQEALLCLPCEGGACSASLPLVV